MEKLRTFAVWLRRYISPVFVTMFFAAFVLWYITKLGYDYTTNYQIAVTVEGETFDVDCKIHGKGIDLFNVKVLSRKPSLSIPLAELRYEQVEWGMIRIDPESLQRAVASRIGDIDLISVGAVPTIDIRHKEER